MDNKMNRALLLLQIMELARGYPEFKMLHDKAHTEMLYLMQTIDVPPNVPEGDSLKVKEAPHVA